MSSVADKCPALSDNITKLRDSAEVCNYQFEMSDKQTLPVLRCELCSKPFNKESTMKRHGYYCRARNGSRLNSRMRSCIACAKAKARCDNTLPTCSRCTTKNLLCHHVDQSSAKKERLGDVRLDQPDVEHYQELSIPSFNDVTPPSLNIDSGFPELSALEFVDVETEGLVWNTYDAHKAGTHSLNQLNPRPRPPIPMDAVSIDQATKRTPYIPEMPSYELRSFAQKPASTGSGSMTATLILRILISYPVMLRNHKTPPPFIHPSFLNFEDRSMDSLTACSSLMQMLGSGGQGSKSLVWKNVRLECERMQAQWTEFDAWQLLSSMQALLVYMLLRLQEGETSHNNFDVALLMTMWTVGCAMNHKIGNFDCGSPNGLSYGSSYQDWVFEESRRRLALTFRVISMLYSTEPTVGCFLLDGFLLAPLPARKQLWEASDEDQWMWEKSRDAGDASMFGIKIGGQMVKLNGHSTIMESDGRYSEKLRQSEEAESSANWQGWCSGMDELGALVMLVASLPI